MRNKTIGIILVLFMLFILPLSVFAANETKKENIKKPDKYKVNLDTIDKILLNNSSYLKDENIKRDRLVKEHSSTYSKVNRAIRDDVNNDPAFWDIIASGQSKIEELESRLVIGDLSRESNLRKQALTAKHEYLNYIKIQNDIKSTEQKDAYLQAVNSIAYAKYKKGLISLREYNEQINKQADYKADIIQNKNKLLKQYIVLKKALGLKDIDILEIEPINISKFENTDKNNLDNDIKTAIDKSTAAKVIKEKIRKTKKTYPVDETAIEDLEKERVGIADNISKQMKEIKADLEEADFRIARNKTAWDNAKSEVQTAQMRFARGLLSKSKYDEIKNKNSDFIDNEIKIKMEIVELNLKYEMIKLGYMGGEMSNGIGE